MRIALALSGEIRSFLASTSLLDSLRQRDGSVIDVFAHVPADDASTTEFIDFWKKDHPGFCLRTLQLSDVRNVPEYSYNVSPDLITRSWYKVSATQAVLRHIAATAAVGAIVRQAELQDDKRYDWVIKTRYDLRFVRPPEQLCELEPALYVPAHDNYYGCNDRFAVGTSELMERYMQLSSAVPYLCESGVLFHPERLLKAHLDTSGIVVNRTTAICWALRHGHGGRITWAPACGDILERRYLPDGDGVYVPEINVDTIGVILEDGRFGILKRESTCE